MTLPSAPASRPTTGRGAGSFYRRTLATLVVAGFLGLSSCVSTTLYDVHEDMANHQGAPIDFQVTTVVGMHFLFDILPLFGNGSLDYGIRSFQDAARERGALTMRIAETETTVYWWVYPPISFVIPVVVSRVTGDVQYPEWAALAAPN